MAEETSDFPPPIMFAGAVLDPYRHICAFVDSRAEEYRFLDPFVIDGLENGDKLSLIVDPADRSAHVRHYRHLGLDVATLLANGQVELRTWAEAHLRTGRFDMDAMLMFAEEMMRSSPAPRMRMISDMGWAADPQNGTDHIEYESRTNLLMAHHQHVVICVYDTAKFGGDVVVDVLRTHPMVLIGGTLQLNPFFVPPEEFLKELDQRPRNEGHG